MNICTLTPDRMVADNFFHRSEISSASFNEHILPGTIHTVDLEIFKLICMARFWIEEHGYPPYKLALQAKISTSQCHKMLEPGWNPSLKLLRKIAISLPLDWVRDFENDADHALPRVFTAAASYSIADFVTAECEVALQEQNYDKARSLLHEHSVSVRKWDFSDPKKIEIFTHEAPALSKKTEEFGLPSSVIRPVYPFNSPLRKTERAQHLVHRKPIVYFEKHYLTINDVTQIDSTIHISQYWRLHKIREFENQRQKNIFDLYLSEFDTRTILPSP